MIHFSPYVINGKVMEIHWSDPTKFGQKATGHSDKQLEQLPNVFSMVVIKLKVNSLKGLTACALVAV